LGASFLVSEFVSQIGGYVVSVIGSTNGGKIVNATAPVKSASIQVSPSSGQLSGYWMYFRLYEYVGVGQGEHPDGTTDLTDAEIASIDWGDGTAPQTGPFERFPRPPLYGTFIRHAFEDSGTYNITADLVGYEDEVYTGYPIRPQYNIDGNPDPWIILAGGTMGFRPLDGYQGDPMAPDEHFKSIDWGDGTAVQTPPFTVDGGGYATHVYPTAGVYNALRFIFADDTTVSGMVTVNVAATQEEYDALIAAYEAEKVEQQRPNRDAPEEDATE
jgi:hypothetical protein